MADKSTSPEFERGLVVAKLAMIEIEARNKIAAFTGVEIVHHRTSEILNHGLSLTGDAQEGFIAALAEFVSLALDGCVIIPSRWKPLT